MQAGSDKSFSKNPINFYVNLVIFIELYFVSFPI